MKNYLRPIQYIQNLWVKVGKKIRVEARMTKFETTMFNAMSSDKLISQDLTTKYIYECLDTLNHFNVNASKETKNLSRLGKMSYFCNNMTPKEFKTEMEKIGFKVDIV